MIEFFLYLALGAFAGVLAGLLGVGGGLVIVPVLASILAAKGVPENVVMHLALGTSLATIVATSLASLHAHHRRGAVLWPVVRRLAPGIVVGALAGATIADMLPGASLRVVFGVFALLVALQMGFGAKPAPHRQLPGNTGLSATGAVIGGVSSIVGIGGGSLTVPFLVWCNTAVREAVATSAACGLPIALAGTASFVLMGWNESLPPLTVGYVYIPALVGVAAASVVTAPLGARLAHRVPAEQLKRFFSLFLAFLGMRMLFA